MHRIFFLILFFSYNLIAQFVTQNWHSTVTKENLRYYIDVLTSDSLEGRATGTKGQQKAAQFIASVFQQHGLLPAGDSGTYFQKFKLIRRQMNPSSSLVITVQNCQHTFVWGVDCISTEVFSDSTLTYSLQWIKLPEQPREDFKLPSDTILYIHLDGKTPLAFTSVTDFTSYLQRIASDNTKLILVGINNPLFFDQIQWQARDRFRRKLYSPELSKETQPTVLFLSPSAAKQIEEIFLASTTIENISASFFYNTDTLSTSNVIGFIPGSDSLLAQEYIVITAHHDHLGRLDKTTYYPGADDNASGTSVLLELSRLFAANERPQRSILFISTTAEENGLLGSAYYSEHPVVPFNSLYAAINIDMIGRNDDNHLSSDYIYVITSNKRSMRFDSLLYVINEKTISYTLDYRYNDEHHPMQLVWRSDHVHFSKKGVPVAFFFGGFHQDYHQPSDTKDKIDYDKMERLAFYFYQLTKELSLLQLPLSDK